MTAFRLAGASAACFISCKSTLLLLPEGGVAHIFAIQGAQQCDGTWTGRTYAEGEAPIRLWEVLPHSIQQASKGSKRLEGLEGDMGSRC